MTSNSSRSSGNGREKRMARRDTAAEAPREDMQEKIVRLFPEEADIPEVPLGARLKAKTVPDIGRNADRAAVLTGPKRIVMTYGPGRTGKTTLIRYVVNQALGREGSEDLILISLDTGRQTLQRFYSDVMMPPEPGQDAGNVFLERVLAKLTQRPMNAVIDFPADWSLVEIGSRMPGLIGALQQSGVEPVALFTLSPREDDLNLLRDMLEDGLCPPATSLIINLGLGNPADFAWVRRHSVLQAALNANAVEILMPKLWAASTIERLGVTFGAATGKLDIFDLHRLRVWQEQMQAAFAPIASWLP